VSHPHLINSSTKRGGGGKGLILNLLKRGKCRCCPTLNLSREKKRKREKGKKEEKGRSWKEKTIILFFNTSSRREGGMKKKGERNMPFVSVSQEKEEKAAGPFLGREKRDKVTRVCPP